MSDRMEYEYNREMEAANYRDKSRRRRRKIVSTVIAWIFIVIVAVVVITAIVTFAMTISGKKSLHQETQNNAPNLNMEVPEIAIPTQAPTAVPEPTATPEPGATPAPTPEPTPEPTATPVPTPEPTLEPQIPWQDDWTRYGGKVYDYNEDILTFLVMGIDKNTTVTGNKDKVSGGQSDAMFLVVIDEKNEDISIITVNRDTMVDVYMYGFEKNGVTPVTKAQITVQHGFGDGKHQSAKYTCDAVSRLFYNLPINGYVAINMAAIGTINDAVGGVELAVLEDLTKINKNWTKGAEVHLDGKDAYDYVHYRDVTVFESARGRLARQKQYLNAFVDKTFTAVKKDVTMPVKLYNSISPYMVTDITADEVAYLASKLVGYEFSGRNLYAMEGTTITTNFEEFYPDYDALKRLMITVFYDEVDLSQYR
ncbi:MAG: LCP family protein [Lachnospiraceae bacterium]|nr:LCP family protein [Lachnospiraceae bacterium]